MSSSLTQEILALMGRYRVNQTQLCRDLGWSKPYLSRRINDEIAWSFDDIEAIAAYFDRSVPAIVSAAYESGSGDTQDSRRYYEVAA